MRFDDSKIEEIKSRADIVELASEYLTLKKAGRNYLGLCPFHQEKTPSFTVNREKQIFYCFGCGEGGNVITLLMKIANKSFPEAVKYLAEKTGVLLPVRTFGSDGREKESLRDGMFQLNARAARYFARQLSSPAGKAARDYLQKRAVTEETVRQFRLGYAPDAWRSLADDVEGGGLSLKMAEQAGLVIAGKEGGFYDRFRGRLMFPIENPFGEIVAFGGRIIGEGEPKYLNSPESPVYSKGKNLYGLNKAKETIRRNGFCLIVEGYFDVISLWNAGVRNVVATLGTALTRDHLELLRRYTQDVVALFDPDAAGRKALDRSLELFLGANMSARALILPDGLDPDDFVKKYGPAKLEELIALAPAISDYYIDSVLGNGKTFEENRDLVKTAMEFVGKINNEIEKNLFIKRIAEKSGIDQALLKREIHRKPASAPSGAGVKKPSGGMAVNPLEFNLIRLMLEYPQKALLVDDENILECFLEPALKDLGTKIIQTYKLLGYVDVNILLPSDEDKPLREHLYKMSVEAPPTDDDRVERNFVDNMRRIREKWYKEQKRQVQHKLRQAQECGDPDLIRELTFQKQHLIKEEHKYLNQS
ncbi:MAG TPA: DNA primase [Smithellaceae bacterium]|nr:DNA primase [Syntrophaceae bacterium]HOU56883.1 DNA primase [Smithellaceae bacterium]MBP9532414.1 DNA primase [Syntrophaceae bacterium]HQH00574.1 DNA primase [Smithellaceae bacterium]HQH05500.1 DNA primase [Smithellaceae bacterium]